MRTHIAEHGKLETAEFKDLIGLGRKVSIQLLEFLTEVVLPAGNIAVIAGKFATRSFFFP